MATKTLLELAEITDALVGTDILYTVRGAGAGRDKQVAADKIISSTFQQDTAGAIDLSAYFADLVILSDPASAIAITTSNALPAGRRLVVVNQSATDDITVDGETVAAGKILIAVSDGITTRFPTPSGGGSAEKYILLPLSENMYVGTNVLFFDMPVAGDFTATNGKVGTAPTGADLRFDVMKNGSSIYTSGYLTVAATATTGSKASTTAFVAGDRIRLDIIQIGSTLPGANACIRLYFTEA